jgi:phosphoribosylaminoimidazole-succinocarboxamide synthase
MEKETYSVSDPLGKGEVEVLKATNLYGSKNPPKRGKVRDVYDLEDNLLIVTTDRVSAFDVVYTTLIPHKGASLNSLSEFWFTNSKEIFPNHFLKSFDDRSMIVKKADRIDVEFVCRAYLYGSAWRSYDRGLRKISGVSLPDGLVMAEELPETIITPTTKSETGHDVEITQTEAVDSGLITTEEWKIVEEATYKLFEFYKSIAGKHGFIIPDFKLEYGRIDGNLIQIDEPPTHDSARFWAESFYEKGSSQESTCLDKEFLRESLRRMGYFGDGPPPIIPTPVVREVSKRCVASYEVLTGKKKLSDFDLKTVEDVMEELSR